MRTLGIIPARAGSTRLPGKNLKQVGGMPLVERAITTALAASQLDFVVVTSDDREILRRVVGWPGVVALERPAHLATAAAPSIGYVTHALECMAHRGESFDAIAIVQPTSPFTEPRDIDETVRLLKESGADSAVTVSLIDQMCHPTKLKRLQGDRLLEYGEDEAGRMAFESIPPLYARNGSVYCSRIEQIEAGELLGPDCRAVVMPRIRSVDINDALDLAFAQFLASGVLERLELGSG